MANVKLDILAFAAHPDDVELSCSGTLIKHIQLGYKVGIIDLTRGELGTRGSAKIRDEEALAAAKIMQLTVRENLQFKDGFFTNDEPHQMEMIKVIRKYQPNIVLCNAIKDRHPDHGKASELASTSCFLSGLAKISTNIQDEPQAPWRPRAVYHYIQDRYIEPDFVVDITQQWEEKLKAIGAFKSQFFNPQSKEPVTPIATEDFWNFLEARARQFGRAINASYAEGFTVERDIGIDDITILK